MTNDIEIRRNPTLTPTFEDGEVVYLTRDLESPNELPYEYHPGNKYFKKNGVFVVIECGLSECFISKTGATLNPVDDEELCIVEVISEELDEIDYIQGVVNPKDLRIDTYS